MSEAIKQWKTSYHLHLNKAGPRHNPLQKAPFFHQTIIFKAEKFAMTSFKKKKFIKNGIVFWPNSTYRPRQLQQWLRQEPLFSHEVPSFGGFHWQFPIAQLHFGKIHWSISSELLKTKALTEQAQKGQPELPFIRNSFDHNQYDWIIDKKSML